MEAGWRLNKLVAEVRGLYCIPHDAFPDLPRRADSWYEMPGYKFIGHSPPAFSTDMLAAWPLFLEHENWILTNYGGGTLAIYNSLSDFKEGDPLAVGMTGPHVISLAFLREKGVEV